MKKLFMIAAIALFGFGTADAQNASGETENKEKSLYQRLGGYDAMAAVSDDFIGRLASSKLLGRFVVGLSDDSKKKLRQHFVEFLCNAAGGSCVYTGRDMKTSHTGLGITEEDWKESVKLLNETFDKIQGSRKRARRSVSSDWKFEKDFVRKK